MNGRVTRRITAVVVSTAAAADVARHIDDMHRRGMTRGVTRRELHDGMHERCSNHDTHNERDLR